MKNILHLNCNPDRIYGLDILRALAILFVVAGHRGTLPKAYFKFIDLFIFDGVTIFFVLSGFLIGGILIRILNEKGTNPALLFDFWIRRWFRTLPNYFFMLILLLSLNMLFTPNFSVSDHLHYFLFSQNLTTAHPPFFSEAWSLSVEEWFYLFIPVIIFSCINLFRLSVHQSVLVSILGIIIGITLFRYYRYFSSEVNSFKSWDLLFRKQVFTRLDSLIYGVLGAYVSFYFPDLWNKSKTVLFFTGLGLLVCLKFNLWGGETFGMYQCVFSFSVMSVATLCLLPLLHSVKNGNGYIFKFITYTSLVSYSMYLTNLSVVQEWIMGNMNWVYLQHLDGRLVLIIKYASYWALTYFISILLYKYLELPAMNVRDRIKFKRQLNTTVT